MSQPQRRRGECWVICGLETRWANQLQRNKEIAPKKPSRKVSSAWLESHGHPREHHGHVLGTYQGGVPCPSHRQQLLWLQQWHYQRVAGSLGGLPCTRDQGTLCKVSRISRTHSQGMLPPRCPMAGGTWEMVSAGAIPALATTRLSLFGSLCFYCPLLATTGFRKLDAVKTAMLCYPGSSLCVSAAFEGRRRRRHRVTLLRARLGPQVIRKAVCLRGAIPRPPPHRGNHSNVALLSKSHAVPPEYAVVQD